MTPIPLLLRPWRADDLPALRAAIDESLDEVQRWLPWGKEEPSTPEQLAARVERYMRDSAEGRNWRLALVDARDGTLVGSGALLHHHAPGTMEVGYWVRRSFAGQGIATRTAAAIVRHAFEHQGAARMELWTLPGNAPSMAVARRLGFTARGQQEMPRGDQPPQCFEIFTLERLEELLAPPDPLVEVRLS